MMKKYSVQKGDTLDSIAEKFRVKDGKVLRAFHNMHCHLEDLLGYEVQVGKELLIPEDSKYLKDENVYEEEPFIEKGEDFEFGDEGVDTMSATETEKQESQKEKKNEEQQKSSSSEHDGKYFVIQKGMCQCNQGFKFPKFKVTSHQKHYWNDEEGNADYLAVTEDDLTLDPPAMPFGNCKLKPSSGGYLPCAYAPAGKWQKTYEKVKVLGKSCLTEISELMCSTGGKITILKHGQQSEIGKSHVMNANSQEQQIYNPVVNFDGFKEETNESYLYDYE